MTSWDGSTTPAARGKPGWRWTGVAIGIILVAVSAGVVPMGWWPWSAMPGASSPAAPGPASLSARQLMEHCAADIAQARRSAGLIPDAGTPPADAAFVGSELTALVTTLGNLEAKRLAARPAWATLLTEQLAAVGVGPGTVVAANFSGSFPGLNLATICAAQSLGADVVAAASVTASTFGASDPGFTWPEIEMRLVAAGHIRPATVVVSVGGDGDIGRDLDDDGRQLAAGIADRAAQALGAVRLRPATVQAAIDGRIAAIDTRRGSRRIAVFVNVGGAEASVGRSVDMLGWQSGWLETGSKTVARSGGVMGQMAIRGVPILHLLNVRDLASRWGLPSR